MVAVVKPSTKPQVTGSSGIASSLGFNAYTPDRLPFGLLTDFESIRDNLRNIIFFRKGDYPDLPEFGIGLQDYLFDPGDELLRMALAQESRRQIAKYEPRITIRSLLVDTPQWADGGVVLSMDLLVNGSSLTGTATASGNFNLSRAA
jgi:phage baseplate assembly protein W